MGVNKFAAAVGKIQAMNPWEVAANSEVQSHIVALYNSIHGEGGEAFAERESRYIDQKVKELCDGKRAISSLSVFLAYVDLAVKNLTLEPGAQALCYLLNRNSSYVAADGKTYWETRVYISITGYGEILLRQRAGQIRHCDTPTVVYEGDKFSYEEENGRKYVSYGLNIAHNTANPIACFMKITRIDDTIDYAIILPEGWQRLQKYSAKQNSKSGKEGCANALYTSGINDSIDPGFLIAKCVKHAFKSYPKLPIGKGMVMEADLPKEESMADYYNMGGGETSEAEQSQPKTDTGFAPAPDHSAGVTVDPSATDSDDDTW